MRSHLGMHAVMWPFTCSESSRVAFLPGWGAWNLLSKLVPVTVDCHFSQSYCHMYLPIYITRRFRVFHRGLLYNREWRHGWSLLSSRLAFLRRFKGRQVFTYHVGRLLSHWISFYQHHTRYHVNGFGGCWWGLHFMRGKHWYGCAPIWRFCTVSSRQIRPSNGRLSFRPKLLPSVLTHIYYKKVQTISQRSPVKWRVETRLVVSSWGFLILFKEGRYSLTTMVDCCLIRYPFTNIAPDTMWMDLWGVGGVSTSCKASIGMDGRLSFPNELFLFVLTLIQYKMSDNEFRRALAQ
jgi:hypothetical protein